MSPSHDYDKLPSQIQLKIAARIASDNLEKSEKTDPNTLNLAAHAIYPISTGKLEGFNNKIKVTKRIGYGYRDDDFFFTLIRYLSISSVPSPSHNNP